MKTAIYIAITVLAVSAITGLAFRARAQVVWVVPYTVVLAETVVREDGSRRSAPSQTWAVRSDGTVAAKLGSANPGSRQIRFPSGIHMTVNDRLRAKSTNRVPVEDVWVLDPRENCTKTITGISPAGQSAPMIEQAGYRTAKIMRGGTTHWYALDYGGALVKRRIDFGTQGASELDLVSLIRGEPNSEWFIVPPDYREGPPSSLVGPRPNCDAACQEKQRGFFEELDRSYYAHRIP